MDGDTGPHLGTAAIGGGHGHGAHDLMAEDHRRPEHIGTHRTVSPVMHI